jgi:hypothetical protein
MAFRTRRRVVQPKDPICFVSLKDPEINNEKPKDGGSDTTAYKESSGRDRSGLVFIGEPTEFHCMPLGSPQLKDCQVEGLRFDPGSSAGNVSLCRAAFWAGCKVVKPWTKDDGTTGPLPRREWDEQLDLNIQVEIGGYILGLSEMEDTDPKS